MTVCMKCKMFIVKSVTLSTYKMHVFLREGLHHLSKLKTDSMHPMTLVLFFLGTSIEKIFLGTNCILILESF